MTQCSSLDANLLLRQCTDTMPPRDQHIGLAAILMCKGGLGQDHAASPNLQIETCYALSPTNSITELLS